MRSILSNESVVKTIRTRILFLNYHKKKKKHYTQVLSRFRSKRN